MGLTEAELRREVRWRMHRIPDDPAKVTEFLTELMVGLIGANNEAIAAHLAQGDEPHAEEAF